MGEKQSIFNCSVTYILWCCTFCIILEYVTTFFVITGIWTAAQPLHSEERWIHYVVVQHPGVVAFFVLDIIILIAATTLTTAQASQVFD